jgi:glycosyltransferase involved in cell wall biosynthesis
MNNKCSSEFQVSVIIPVYNREKFLLQAVESALNLTEVGEIILVDDGSSDGSLNLCKNLVKEHSNILLLQHSGGVNKGISASRNLGIKNASKPFISFLDSDDWYLGRRFLKDKIIFNNYPFCDAVYSSVILEENQNEVSKIYGLNFDIRKSIGMKSTPKEFYKTFLNKRKVIFHTNSVTFKKEFLLKGQLFDDRLKLHEDTELWMRLLRRGNFFAGEISNPVAVIRRHENNTITSRSTTSVLKMNAIHIENVGISNLYNFEKINLLKTIIRHKSKSINNIWKRRFYYYSRYFLGNFNIDKYLIRFKNDVLEK